MYSRHVIDLTNEFSWNQWIKNENRKQIIGTSRLHLTRCETEVESLCHVWKKELEILTSYHYFKWRHVLISCTKIIPLNSQTEESWLVRSWHLLSSIIELIAKLPAGGAGILSTQDSKATHLKSFYSNHWHPCFIHNSITNRAAGIKYADEVEFQMSQKEMSKVMKC